jgi:hypothetical protein
MTPSDILFQRAILASLLLFAVLGTAYFRLAGPRTFSAAVRFLPMVGAAFVAAPIVFSLPVVAKLPNKALQRAITVPGFARAGARR